MSDTNIIEVAKLRSAAYLEEYKALRAEITQSIAKQHQILLAGYGLSATIFGYVIGKSTDLKFAEPIWGSLATVPFVFLAMAALWTVETNRMVRASYYIGYVLWPIIKRELEMSDPIGWETWIRQMDNNGRKPEDRLGSLHADQASSFRRMQHILQSCVAFYIPVGASCVTLGVANQALWTLSPSLPTSLWVLILIVWTLLFTQLRKVTNLAAVSPKKE